MRYVFLLLLSSVLIKFSSAQESFNQDPGNPNLDFSAASFDNWQLSWGPLHNPELHEGPAGPSTHIIVENYGNNWDANAGIGNLPRVPSGLQRVARLGHPSGHGYGDPASYKLKYTITVNEEFPILFFQIASVLDLNHQTLQNTHYKFAVKDASGQHLPTQPCTGLILAPYSAGNNTSYTDPPINYALNTNFPNTYQYHVWESVALDLSGYAGQTITLELEHYDCYRGYHGSYTYFSAAMRRAVETIYFCEGETSVDIEPYIPRFESYLWNTGATSESITINNPVDGSFYTVDVGSYNQCSTTFSYELKKIQLLADFEFSEATVCEPVQFTDLSTVDVGEIIEWNWNFNDTGSGTNNTSTAQNPVHHFMNPGTYNVSLTVKDNNGCSKMIEIPVEVLAEKIPEFIQVGPICAGDELDELPTESLNGISGTWTPEMNNTETTQYTFYPDQEQCAAETTMTIQVLETVELELPETVSACYGQAAQITAVTPAQTVNWYDSEYAETPIFSGFIFTTPELIENTVYWAEADNGNCGSERMAVEITIMPVPELELPTIPEICSGETVSLTVIPTNGTVVWYYQENDTTPFHSGVSYETPPLNTTTTFWLEVIDGDCKSERKPLTVTVNELPTIDTVASAPVCVGNSVELSVITNGTIVNWYDEENSSSPIFTGNPFITPELTETTSYWVSSLNESDCKSERIEVIATVTDEIVPAFTQIEPICFGTELTLPNESDNGITGTWTPEINNVQTTTYTFHPNEGQCSTQSTMTIEIVEIPELELPGEEELISCIGEPVNITIITNGSTIYWYTSATSQTPFHSGTDYNTPPLNDTTTYYIEAATGNCTSERYPVTITVYPTPEMQELTDITICDGESYEFTAPEGFDYYEWTDQDGNTISQTAGVVFTEEGTYQLQAGINGIPCSVYRDLEVSFSTTPTITEIKSTENTLTVYATGDGPLEYSLNEVFWQGSNIFQNLQPGIYFVFVRDRKGCGTWAKQGALIGVPNFISPNGDGYNDTWKIRALEAFPNTRLQIFDRYGKLFVDKILTTGFEWNGKYNNQQLPSGTYWYIITLQSGEKLNGSINIRNN